MSDPAWLTPIVRDGWRRFQARHGLAPDGLPGAKTLEAVEGIESRAVTQPTITSPTPRWLIAARRYIGVREKPGADNEEKILEWLATTALGRWGRSRDSTPWCSAFVNAMFERSGLEGTKSAMARSWLGWGVPCQPRVGAVAIFPRGAPPSGHVGFVDHVALDQIGLLGGNQGNAVSVQMRSLDDALGYRWPAEGDAT